MLLILLLSMSAACVPAGPGGENIPTGMPEQTDAPQDSSRPVSEDTPKPDAGGSAYERYHKLAGEILSGEIPESFGFDHEGDMLYFGFDGEYFCAYTSAERDDGHYEEGYVSELAPFESYPRSLGEEAQRAVARERISAFPLYELDPDFKARMTGYAGEDCVIVANGADLDRDEAVSCIFVRGADGEWTEIGNANAIFPRRLTGACMLSEKEGYLCFSDRFYETNGPGRKLHVFHTVDGGESWADVGLELPEKYGEPSSLIPYSPVFDGEHGVIPVTASFFDGDRLEAWFETKDGGESWLLVDPSE